MTTDKDLIAKKKMLKNRGPWPLNLFKYVSIK